MIPKLHWQDDHWVDTDGNRIEPLGVSNASCPGCPRKQTVLDCQKCYVTKQDVFEELISAYEIASDAASPDPSAPAYRKELEAKVKEFWERFQRAVS
jgi:hypothetical protein